MSKYGILGVVAVVLAVSGVIIQIAFDERGFYLAIGEL